jgi:hypothetical protein
MPANISVELFLVSSCNSCGQAKQQLRSLIDEISDNRIHYRELDVLEQLDYAVSLGVLTPSAIAIDGKLVFATMPSIKQLRAELQRRLQALS